MVTVAISALMVPSTSRADARHSAASSPPSRYRTQPRMATATATSVASASMARDRRRLTIAGGTPGSTSTTKVKIGQRDRHQGHQYLGPVAASGAHFSARAATIASCSRPLVASACGPACDGWPAKSVSRPPASARISDGAARSQRVGPDLQHHLGGALGDQHVAPELAESAIAPDPRGQPPDGRPEARLFEGADPRGDELGLLEAVDGGNVDRPLSKVVARDGALATGRPPATRHGRRRDGGHDQLPLFLDGQQGAEDRNAADQVMGAVDGVHDPARSACAGLAAEFLAQYAVIGKAPAMRSRMRVSTSVSAWVTSVASALALTVRPPARWRSTIASASSSSSRANWQRSRCVRRSTCWAGTREG